MNKMKENMIHIMLDSKNILICSTLPHTKSKYLFSCAIACARVLVKNDLKLATGKLYIGMEGKYATLFNQLRDIFALN